MEKFIIEIDSKICIQSKYKYINEIGNRDIHIHSKHVEYDLYMSDTDYDTPCIDVTVKGIFGVMNHIILISNEEYVEMMNKLKEIKDHLD